MQPDFLGPSQIQLVAVKYTRNMNPWIFVYRNPDNTTEIVRTSAKKHHDAGSWTNENTPEDWISLNNSKSSLWGFTENYHP